MALLVTSFHAGVAVYNIVVSKWLKENMLQNLADKDDIVLKTMKRFSLRYLTNWTFTLLTLYFIVCLFEDIIFMFKGGEFLRHRVRKIKNYMFTVLVAPMTMLVSVVFWGVWFVDRELIFPKIIDAVLPLWINHSLHTTTSIIVVIEMCISSHQYPKFKNAVIGISLYLAVYLICLVGTYFESGEWLYPLFKVADWPLKITLFVVCYALAVGLYSLQQFFMSLQWVEKQRPKPIKKKSKRH